MEDSKSATRRAQSFYDQVTILVCDPVAANRASTRSGLYALGYRQIEMVTNLDDFAETLDRCPPDLALCDIQAGQNALCEIIYRLRQGINQYNPFVVTLATAWSANENLMRQIVNCGADDFLLRPFSTSMLNARIEAHTFRRKKFVITADYVGPERRSIERATSAKTFDPPNSLKIRAEAPMAAEAATRRIAAALEIAREELHVEKLKCESIKLSGIARYLSHEVTLEVGPDLQSELSAISTAIDARARGARLEGWQGAHNQLLMATANLKDGVGNVALAELSEAAMSLAKHFNAGKISDQLNREIEDAANVARVRASKAKTQSTQIGSRNDMANTSN